MTPRILIHVQHLLGVGHLMRAAALSKALSDDGLEVMLVSGGMPHDGLEVGRATFVQLPALQARGANYATLVDTDDRPVDDTFRAHRRDMLLAMARGFDPHVVMTEHFPFGRGKLRFELDPLLADLSSRTPRPLCVASVRDIIEPPESREKEERFLADANEHYDAILVHGDPAFLPFDRSFPAAARLKPPVMYTGYVGEAPPKPPARRSGILVSCGNGRTGQRLVDASLKAHKLDDLNEDWEIRLGAGFKRAEPIERETAHAPRLTVTKSRPHFAAALAQAALSVSQAGYNTIVDIAAAQANAILVPYAGYGEREQRLRAHALEQVGQAAVVPEESLSPETLLTAMKNALATHAHPNSDRPFRLGGAQQTVTLVKEAITASGYHI